MGKTTIQMGTDTRNRLRALASEGETLEDVVVHALDTLEEADFWRRAESAAARRASDPTLAAAYQALDDEVDSMWIGL
jgi:hypothetical protein